MRENLFLELEMVLYIFYEMLSIEPSKPQKHVLYFTKLPKKIHDF